MKHKIEVDEKTGQIKFDSEVPSDSRCWEYYTSSPEYTGYGVVASSREICVKKINKVFKNKVKEVEKNLKILQKTVARFEKQLEAMKEGIK